MPMDILFLCTPDLPRDGHPYEGDTKIPSLKPLRLETVLEGHTLPPTTNRLLSLPSTAWELILNYLSGDIRNLRNLALVNFRCNILAKTVQFCSVKLTYSDNAVALLTRLGEEAQDRLSNRGYTQGLALGPFIRKLVIKTKALHIGNRHEFGMCTHFRPLSGKELRRRLAEGNEFYFENYIGCLSRVLELGAVPNLFTFDWRDRITVPLSLIEALLHSPVKAIRLNCYFNPICPCSGANYPPLDIRSLSLWGVRAAEFYGPDYSRTLYSNLLTVCAPTLETLCFPRTTKMKCEILFDPSKPQPEFPRLRVLQLGAPFLSASVKCLLSAELYTLIIDGAEPLPSKQAGDLGTVGPIPTLRTLVCRRELENPTSILSFLSQNPQLTKLCVRTSTVDRVLSLLAQKFHAISSLSLISQSCKVTESTLQPISQLETLEQLHLSLSIDSEQLTVYPHHLIREALSHLPKLRRLAFVHDTYIRHGLDEDRAPPSRYYMTTDTATPQERAMAEERNGLYRLAYDVQSPRQLFELAHKNWMLRFAEFYARRCPELEFVYMGQRAMQVGVVTMGECREGCFQAIVEEEVVDEAAKEGVVEGKGQGVKEENVGYECVCGMCGVVEAGAVDTKVYDDDVEVKMAFPLLQHREDLLTYIYRTWGDVVETWGWDY